MMSFFYSPAAAARSRRGRDKEHPHRRASSASTSGRRAKDLTKPHEFRSPTPRSPQATSVPPSIVSNRPRSLVVSSDATVPSSTSTVRNSEEIDPATIRPGNEGSFETEKTNPTAQATLHSSQHFRTPAALQPYLEDDTSEKDECSKPATSVDKRSAARPEADDLVREDSGGQEAAPEGLRRFRPSSEGVAPTVLKSALETSHLHHHAVLLASSQSMERAEAFARHALEQKSLPSPQKGDYGSRRRSEDSEGAGMQMEMQERRRSRLSQVLAQHGESMGEPSNSFARTFTPPSGPLGAIPSHTPLFMSPIPMRATIPTGPEQTVERSGVPVYPPSSYYAYPSFSSDRSSGNFPHIPYYMDQVIQPAGPSAFYHPLDPASSMGAGEGHALRPQTAEAVAPSFDYAQDVLARVENALPSVHRLVHLYKETSNQTSLQLTTLRQADAEKNDLLREKDHYIHQLLVELEQDGQRHRHEQESLEEQLVILQRECKHLRDGMVLGNDSGQYIKDQPADLSFKQKSFGTTKSAVSGPMPYDVEESCDEGHAKSPAKSSESLACSLESSTSNTTRHHEAHPIEEDPASDRMGTERQGESASVASGVSVAEKAHLAHSAAHASTSVKDSMIVTDGSERSPLAAKTLSMDHEPLTELMPGSFDLCEGKKTADLQEGPTEKPDQPVLIRADALSTENAELRRRLERLQVQWSHDRTQLAETNHRLERAATKLGIENVSLACRSFCVKG